jgi:hypothetical protein
LKIECKQSGAWSTWGIIDKVASLEGVVLCAGADARWLVVAIPDGEHTELYLFREALVVQQCLRSVSMQCVRSVSIGIAMADSPLRVLRDATSASFGKQIEAFERSDPKPEDGQ